VRDFPREDCDRVRREVAQLLDRACGVVRTAAALDDARTALEKLRRSLLPREADDARLLAAAEALGALTFASALVESVSARAESLGPHLRFASADSPEPVPRDDSLPPEWTLVSKSNAKVGDELLLRREVPPGLPFDMPQ
jgi:succinate dehydrogenase/fumarate reductase flavoprotein subunit